LILRLLEVSLLFLPPDPLLGGILFLAEEILLVLDTFSENLIILSGGTPAMLGEIIS